MLMSCGYEAMQRNMCYAPCAGTMTGCGCATATPLSCMPLVGGSSRNRLLGEPRSLYASCVMPRLELDPLSVPALLGLLHGLMGVGL